MRVALLVVVAVDFTTHILGTIIYVWLVLKCAFIPLHWISTPIFQGEGAARLNFSKADLSCKKSQFQWWFFWKRRRRRRGKCKFLVVKSKPAAAESLPSQSIDRPPMMAIYTCATVVVCLLAFCPPLPSIHSFIEQLLIIPPPLPSHFRLVCATSSLIAFFLSLSCVEDVLGKFIWAENVLLTITTVTPAVQWLKWILCFFLGNEWRLIVCVCLCAGAPHTLSFFPSSL